MSANGAEDVEQYVDALPRDAAADMEQERGTTQRSNRGEACGSGSVVNSVRDAIEAAARRRWIDQAVLLDLAADRPRRMENQGRLLKAAEDAAGDGTEPASSRMALGLQEAAKGVNVVAKNASTRGGGRGPTGQGCDRRHGTDRTDPGTCASVRAVVPQSGWARRVCVDGGWAVADKG